MTDGAGCPICDGAMTERFRMKLLRRHEVRFDHCAGCGLLRSETPYWLDEAYAEAIADADTGILARNRAMVRRTACVLRLLGDSRAAYLDVAGGYGLFVRGMRDVGFDCYWHDPYCRNLFAKGFTAADAGRPFAALTAFEVLEHVHDPVAFVGGLLKQHAARTIILSTEVYRGEPPAPGTWRYYAPTGGQHITFFQERTLARLAARLGLRFATVRNFHVLTDDARLARWFPLVAGPLSRLLFPVATLGMRSRTIPDSIAAGAD